MLASWASGSVYTLYDYDSEMLSDQFVALLQQFVSVLDIVPYLYSPYLFECFMKQNGMRNGLFHYIV